MAYPSPGESANVDFPPIQESHVEPPEDSSKTSLPAEIIPPESNLEESMNSPPTQWWIVILAETVSPPTGLLASTEFGWGKM